MNERPHAVAAEHVTLAMDYGQFALRGGSDESDDEIILVEQALSAGPHAGNGKTVLVLSPHQNNFEMGIGVERFDARPPADDESWEQICESRVEIDPGGVLQLESPTMEPIDCAA